MEPAHPSPQLGRPWRYPYQTVGIWTNAGKRVQTTFRRKTLGHRRFSDARKRWQTHLAQTIFPPEEAAMLSPDAVSPGLVALVAEDAPSRVILAAGAGGYERVYVTLTQGIHV